MKTCFLLLIVSLILTSSLLGQTQSGVTIDLDNIKGNSLGEVFDMLVDQGFTNIVPVPVPSKLPQETVLGLKIRGQTVEEGVRYSTKLQVRVLVSMGSKDLFDEQDPQDQESPVNQITQHIATDPLIMTGARFQPKSIQTASLIMTGTRFQPQTLMTDTLTMRGDRFQPIVIETASLTMMGVRFQPVAIQTEPLVMIGFRFQPIAIQTNLLTMRGLRNTEPQEDTPPPPKRNTVRQFAPPVQTVEPVQQDTLLTRPTQQDTTPTTVIPLVNPKTPGPIVPVQPKMGN